MVQSTSPNPKQASPAPLPSPSSSHLHDKSMLPILMVMFIDLLGVGIIIPVLGPLFVEPTSPLMPPELSFAARTFLLGLLIALYPIAQFFSSPLLGGLSDRHGRKPILLYALASTALGYLLIGLGILTSNLPLVFLGRLIDGLGGGSVSVAASSISDLSDEKTKAKNFGLIGMMFGLGMLLGPFIGGKLADSSLHPFLGSATPFWFAAGLCLLNIALMLWRYEETLLVRVHRPVDALSGLRNLRKAMGMAHLRALFAVGFLFAFGMTMFSEFFSVFLLSKFGFHASQIGDIFAYLGLWIIFAQGVITRQLASRFSTGQVLSVSLLLLALSLLAVLLPSDPAGLLLILPLVAIFNGLSSPNYYAQVSNLADRQSQGEVMGINQSVMAAGMAIPPLIAGIIIGIQRDLPVLSASVLVLAAWLVFMGLTRSPSPQKKFHDI